MCVCILCLSARVYVCERIYALCMRACTFACNVLPFTHLNLNNLQHTIKAPRISPMY